MNPTVALPYWDSTLESRLPDPATTSLFSSHLMGDINSHGNVYGEHFNNWIVNGRRLRREPGRQGQPFTESDIHTIMGKTDLSSILAFTASRPGCPYPTDWTCLEYMNQNTLLWVGGDISEQTTATSDPLFFLHHAFLDYLWESWRQSHQTPDERISLYPIDSPNCSSGDHFAISPMNPFQPLRNIDGLSDAYISQLYTFAPRPMCHGGVDEECHSKYLFCDRSHGYPHCAAKIKPHGPCAGFIRGEKPCMGGVCIEGLCREANMQINQKAAESSRSKHRLRKRDELCFNEHECCSIWGSNGECSTNFEYMSKWCRATCRWCIPSTYDLRIECSDRHSHCSSWTAQGECRKNYLWMTENCRRSCGKCDKHRKDVCKIGQPYDPLSR
ncbi:hypothetical protein AB6A40_006503 [Gnathostoma spinigerum]|uniref:ShKT domain-containing protein n=1 Tax=Gnathostoma spinigerum TaxID=75299 RepID=A0ABD6ENR7_9BILA